MKKNAKRKDTEPSLPEGLTALLGSLKAIEVTNHLLLTGSFTYEYRDAVQLSLQYIQALHKQVLSEAQAHPEAHLVPQFKKKNMTPEEHAQLDKEFTEILDKAVNKDQQPQPVEVQ